MYRSQSLGSPETRRGIILLVVLFMLTLFAIAGLSFVLYADAEAAAARLHREANTLIDVPDMEPELAFSYFLGQLIYDVRDDEGGIYSALRGHSLGRNMYGLFYTATNNVTFTYSNNTVPFVGVGRLHTDPALAGQMGGPNNPYGVDDYILPNYTYYRSDGFLRDPERLSGEGRTSATAAWTYRQYRTDPYDANQRPGPYVGGFNAPYTYPDLNNMFLAHIRSSDGRVVLQSFHRGDWTGFGSLAPSNPNWTSNDPTMKYRVMRPRPIDQLLPGETWPPNRPYFPLPEDEGGDVKNLIHAPGGNDSIWIDIGAPVMTLPGGKKYKMLVAPLIIDLDGRVNLNVHGNLMNVIGTDPQGQPIKAHGSNQGWGPWEVNLGWVMANNEWQRLFLGSPNNRPQLWGKYGPDKAPSAVGTVSGLGTPSPHFYAQVDYNASREPPLAPVVPWDVNGDRLQLPGFGGANPLRPFPGFPNDRYGNGFDPSVVGQRERIDHAREYNPQKSPIFAPPASATARPNDDRVFAASNMAALFRVNDTGSEAITSELIRLCPDNFVNRPDADRIRRLVTTHSFDMNQAGVVPYVYNVQGQPNLLPGTDPTRAPVGAALPYPNPAWRVPGQLPAGMSLGYPYNEFRSNDWRALTAASVSASDVARLDLNRALSRYPSYTGATSYDGRFDPINPTPYVPPAPSPDAPYLTIRNQFNNGRTTRHTFADAIYRRLLQITGLPPVRIPLRPTDEELAPRRWLAQLAVNIVDYLDEDDISTAFNFYTERDAYPSGRRSPRLNPQTGEIIPGDPPFDIGALSRRDPSDPRSEEDPEFPRYWVFGTELPKVVVNEVLVEHQPPANPAPGDRYQVNVWVELLNTMQVLPTTNVGLLRQDGFPIRLNMPALQLPVLSDSRDEFNTPRPQASQAYAPYKVVVANRIMSRRDPNGNVLNDNVLGTPDRIRAQTDDRDFQRPAKRMDGTDQRAHTAPAVPSPYIDSQGGTTGSPFFLLGPLVEDARNTIKGVRDGGRVPDATPIIKSPNLSYKVTVNTDRVPEPNDGPEGVTVLLRRLANPHLPHNPNRTILTFQNQVIGFFQGRLVTTTVENITLNPWYNPYVTVDYLEANPLNDTGNPDNVYASRGKRQPYASYVKRASVPGTAITPDSPVADQQLVVPPPPPDPPLKTIHNFGQMNVPLPPNERYEWLVHLDRELISPMELLHVSGYPPHLLTQKFISPPPNDPAALAPFQHYVPWFDQDLAGTNTSHRLYRFFEHVQCYDRVAGTSASGLRVPGNVNINSIWDLEVFKAVCDPAAAGAPNPNYFTEAQIDQIFAQMMTRRSPGGAPRPGDQPFWGMAVGLVPPPNGRAPNFTAGGIEQTLLASDGTGTRRLFQPPPSGAPDDPSYHPYLQMQLLTKIFNNVTTRSNVFAVWATVGFFEVIDDAARPVKLGAELGRAEGRHIRHRMFAIIDRTALPSNQNPGPQTRFIPTSNLNLVPYFSIIK
jgi:hypothetical protein